MVEWFRALSRNHSDSHHFAKFIELHSASHFVVSLDFISSSLVSCETSQIVLTDGQMIYLTCSVHQRIGSAKWSEVIILKCRETKFKIVNISSELRKYQLIHIRKASHIYSKYTTSEIYIHIEKVKHLFFSVRKSYKISHFLSPDHTQIFRACILEFV